MSNSDFKNPAGLDDQNQYTTPFDLTLAARELLKNPYLAKIVSTKESTILNQLKKYKQILENRRLEYSKIRLVLLFPISCL